jgi:hypothetical protein
VAHLFPFIVLAIVVISKLLANAGRQSGGARPSAPASRTTTPQESEQERMRRFMEAVGLPPDSTPPPVVRPRATTNPPPLLPVKPPVRYPEVMPGRLRRVPPVTTAPPAQPVSRRIPPVPAPMRAASFPEPASMAPPVPQTSAPARASQPGALVPATQPATPARALLERLRDPASIREAIVLREVLGPPRAFHQAW